MSRAGCMNMNLKTITQAKRYQVILLPAILLVFSIRLYLTDLRFRKASDDRIEPGCESDYCDTSSYKCKHLFLLSF